MKAIRTVNLTKHFKQNTAVEDLNLEVEKGELFSLLGVNGAGKTTTIKMLSCLTKPSGGEAFLHQIAIEKELQIKEIIGISPQEPAVALTLSVRENLALMCGINGYGKKETRAKVEEILSSFSMNEIENTHARTLSGGWQRRLSIAMALISQPEILFLDEPTLGLDVIARRELWKVIKALKGKITIVLTTHYLEEAEALSDRIGIMRKGKLVALGKPKKLIEEAGTANFEDAFIKLATDEDIEL